MSLSEYTERGEDLTIEFRAFLILLLDLLEHGEVERAVDKVKEILGK